MIFDRKIGRNSIYTYTHRNKRLTDSQRNNLNNAVCMTTKLITLPLAADIDSAYITCIYIRLYN